MIFSERKRKWKALSVSCRRELNVKEVGFEAVCLARFNSEMAQDAWELVGASCLQDLFVPFGACSWAP